MSSTAAGTSGEHGRSPGVPSGTPAREVHIVVLGWERDRAVLPFKSVAGRPPSFNPQRIYIIVPNPRNSKGYDDMVMEDLKDVAEVIRVPLDFPSAPGQDLEFESILESVAGICRKEEVAGNRVHINMSAGGTLASLAAGVVGMALLTPSKGSVYYVRPLQYPDDPVEQAQHGISSGLRDIKVLPSVEMHLPEPHLLKVLKFLRRQSKAEAKFVALAEHLHADGDSALAPALKKGTRAEQSKALMHLKRKYVDPLEKQGLIEVEKAGRSGLARLKPKGHFYALMGPSIPDAANAHNANVNKVS